MGKQNHRKKVNGLQLVVSIMIVLLFLLNNFSFLGDKFLTAVNKALGGELPLVAEDLGHLTQEVFDLRDKFGLVGMRVLQFGFGSDATSIHLPHNYVQDCVVYTGTHDNNTTSNID